MSHPTPDQWTTVLSFLRSLDSPPAPIQRILEQLYVPESTLESIPEHVPESSKRVLSLTSYRRSGLDASSPIVAACTLPQPHLPDQPLNQNYIPNNRAILAPPESPSYLAHLNQTPNHLSTIDHMYSNDASAPRKRQTARCKKISIVKKRFNEHSTVILSRRQSKLQANLRIKPQSKTKAGAIRTRGCTSLVPDRGLLQRLQDEDSSNQGVGELSMKQQGNISDTWIESQEYAKAPEHTRRWILETISVFADSAEMNLANVACHTWIYQFKSHLYDGGSQPDLYVKNDLWSLTERCRHGEIRAETGAFIQCIDKILFACKVQR